MWVWQSQAPAGMSKLTGVEGWAAAASAVRLRMVTPAAIEATSILRLVNIVSLPGFALSVRAGRCSARSCAGDYRGKARPGRAMPPANRRRRSAIDSAADFQDQFRQ